MLAAHAELAGLLAAPAFLLLDLVVRHRRFDAPRLWRVRAFAVSAAAFGLSMGVTLGWGALIGDRSLLPGHRLGPWLGAAVGVFVYQLVHYGYHRLAHRWDPLWRWSHQMHHSAESLDAFGAYFLHPLDVVFFTTWSSLVFFPLLGVSLEAGALGGAFLALNAVFQHANLRTPRWLGYLVQRPESHSVHHRRHRWNYADLPLIDMMFGTFRNPAEMEQRVGFYKGASAARSFRRWPWDCQSGSRCCGAGSCPRQVFST